MAAAFSSHVPDSRCFTAPHFRPGHPMTTAALVHRWDYEGPSTALLATPTPESPRGLLLTGPGSLAETLSCGAHSQGGGEHTG